MPLPVRQEILYNREGAFFIDRWILWLSPASPGSAQRLCEVVDNVLYIFDADRESDQVRSYTACDQLFIRELAVSGVSGMKHAGVCICDVRSDHCHFEVLHEFFRSSASALETEGDDSAGAVRHVLMSALVVLVAGKAGIGYPGDLFMSLKELGDLLRVLTVPGHADSERLDAEI